ncbi:dTDP-4-dehydrorhamnose reductase [Ramlibacter algicola]|uniref:dTDP-4-dehydrorhamnose reductase n=1 Tax=Ramlibacter algicola TaxID=2795217 RepID=A0A934PYL8_9BURK|nr:dTDP-4-dehydrorhamnose reductase [Ramlibacter algicola]MBK0391965.1 dTDP-4-dehydrorhamnose reductase [Ramlibacter algicola]
MKILLFGCNGQVGWELQRSLAALGELVAIDAAGEGDLRGDFSAPDAVAATVRAVQPDVIVNAAAYTAVDKAETDAATARLVNAATPCVIAREARSLGALLVHYSTDYVFDGSGDRPWQETDAAGPLNVYGATKLEGERLVLEGCPRAVVLRTSWVYGARGNNFAKTMVRLARDRDQLQVVDDQVGAPTGADLLADITAHLVRGIRGGAPWRGLFHAAAAGATSWHAYAQFVLHEVQRVGLSLRIGPDAVVPVPSSQYATAARRPLNSRLDTSRLREATGLVLPHWQAGVRRMLVEAYAGDRP